MQYVLLVPYEPTVIILQHFSEWAFIFVVTKLIFIIKITNLKKNKTKTESEHNFEHK